MTNYHRCCYVVCVYSLNRTIDGFSDTTETLSEFIERMRWHYCQAFGTTYNDVKVTAREIKLEG